MRTNANPLRVALSEICEARSSRKFVPYMANPTNTIRGRRLAKDNGKEGGQDSVGEIKLTISVEASHVKGIIINSIAMLFFDSLSRLFSIFDSPSFPEIMHSRRMHHCYREKPEGQNSCNNQRNSISELATIHFFSALYSNIPSIAIPNSCAILNARTNDGL